MSPPSVTGCGGRLTAPFGTLHSPSYPQNYGPKDDCIWKIEVAENHAVQFTLNDLDIDFNYNCSTGYLRVSSKSLRAWTVDLCGSPPLPSRRCELRNSWTACWEQVVDGPDLDGETLMHVCGNSMPVNNTVTASGNVMTVRMSSTGTRSAKGFKASYATVCGSRILTNSSGIIASHDAINSQGQNPNCSWTVIATDPSQHVTLTISQLTVSHVDEESQVLCLRPSKPTINLFLFACHQLFQGSPRF